MKKNLLLLIDKDTAKRLAVPLAGFAVSVQSEFFCNAQSRIDFQKNNFTDLLFCVILSFSCF